MRSQIWQKNNLQLEIIANAVINMVEILIWKWGWMCWCHLRQGVPVYGCGIPLRLLFDACVCYPPVAQTR